MDNKNNQHTENPDFTGKGRTSNPENAQGKEDESADISNIDQQEGELDRGTISKDQGLFSKEDESKSSS